MGSVPKRWPKKSARTAIATWDKSATLSAPFCRTLVVLRCLDWLAFQIAKILGHLSAPLINGIDGKHGMTVETNKVSNCCLWRIYANGLTTAMPQ